MLLTLIRHGEVHGRTQVLRGSSDDTLSEYGYQQMQAIVNTVQEPVTTVATSPMKRCHDYANEWSMRNNTQLLVMDTLREIDFGEWENLTLQEAEAHDPQCFHDFKHDTDNWQPPNGEPYQLFRARVRQSLQEICSLQTKHVLAFTHGGVIRAMIAELLQLSTLSAARIGIPLAGLCQLWIDGNETGSLLRLDWIEQSCR